MSYIIVGAAGSGISWVTAPTTSNDPGVPGSLAYDVSGNLYLCYATNKWVKFTGSTAFGMVGLLLLRNGIDHLLLRDAASKLELAHV